MADREDQKPVDLRDLSPGELEEWLIRRGRPSYRAEQILHWLYRRPVREGAGMKNLPADLKAELLSFSLFWPREVRRQISGDGAEKILFAMADGEGVETVWIPEGKRATVCVSTQVGCRRACRFCRTGQGGWRRQLSPSEILLQVLALSRPVTNIVFMGMGEPLDNLPAVRRSLELLCEPRALAFSPRRITLSTIGVSPGIKFLREHGPLVNLALSLHSARPATRRFLLPAAGSLDLAAIKHEITAYQQKIRRRVTVEVVLIRDINDRPEEAHALVRWLSGLAAKVNLIPFNPLPESEFQSPAAETVRAYQQILQSKGIPAFLRHSRGQDILAACGQLRAS